MIIRDSDLEKAVTQNIISAEQATQLRTLVQERPRRTHGSNERFVVVNNLAEVFVSIGQLLFFGALFITVRSIGGASALVAPVVGVLVGWAMAEFFARRQLMRWPAIVASIAAALSTGWFVFIVSGVSTSGPVNGAMFVLPLVIVAINLAIAIARYRLPFLALPFAGAIAALALAALPLPRELVFIVIGAAALVTAVWLDLGDRERLTRNSDFAFWLYVAGAPLFLHPIYSSFTEAGQSFANIGGVLVVAFVSCLFGVVLDRRSPIVASLSYLGIIIFWSARALSLTPDAQTALTLFILGVAVMLLGVWWKQARAAVLRLLPAALVRRLPLTEGR